MTVAVCIRCGATKVGALTMCAACAFEPSSADDQAKSLMLSDRELDAEQLRSVARKIANGEAVQFDSEQLDEWKAQAHASADKMPLGCTIAVWTPIVLAIALAIVVAVLFGYCIPRASAPIR